MRNKQTNSKYDFLCILLFKSKGERDWDVETNERGRQELQKEMWGTCEVSFDSSLAHFCITDDDVARCYSACVCPTLSHPTDVISGEENGLVVSLCSA